MSTRKKIALITGGSRGLGKDMALKIAQAGHDVLITYNTKLDEALAVVEEIRQSGHQAAALQLDTAAISTFDQFFTEVARVLKSDLKADKFDYLVNNAGYGISAPSFAATTEEQVDSMLNVHFKGPFFLTQKALLLMNDGGAIVNITTGLTRFTYPGSGAYASAKGAMEILTHFLAKELGVRGIRVNAVAPGAIATDFSGGRLRDSPQIQEHIKSVTALNRIGYADDIGPVVAFLCSDAGKWVTGQRIEASGGQLI